MVLLKDYFYTILPKDIISKPGVAKDIIDIVLEYITDNFSVLYDISAITDFSNNKISDELLKIYLSDLYTIMERAKRNPIITSEVARISKSLNYQLDSYASSQALGEILNREHLSASKDYKQKKGTKFAIEYVYNIAKASGIQPTGIDVNEDDFIFVAGDEEFNFEHIEGSLYDKIYHNIVAYATHPVGFTYYYERNLLTTFVDYFSVSITYVNNGISVICISGNEIEYPYDIKEVTEDGNSLRITFTDNTYLYRNSTSLAYYNANGTIHTDYPNCVLSYPYSIKVDSIIEDIMDFVDDSYNCDWFNTGKRNLDFIMKFVNYYATIYIENGLVGCCPYVYCISSELADEDVTAVCLDVTEGNGRVCWVDGMDDSYTDINYEIQIYGKCDDFLECDGYGAVCEPDETEQCDPSLADYNVALDHIQVELSEE